LTRSAESFTTPLTTIKLRAHFLLINLAILILVELLKGYDGTLNSLG